MGVEPTTTALATQAGEDGSGASEEVTNAEQLRCTNGCTGETEIDVEERVRELVELVRKMPLEVRARMAAEVLKEDA